MCKGPGDQQPESEEGGRRVISRAHASSKAGLPKDSFFPGKCWYHPTPTREKEKRVRKRKSIVEENEKNR